MTTLSPTDSQSRLIVQNLLRPRPPQSLWSDLWHVWVLCSFAVAQPLFDRLLKRPEYFETTQLNTWGVLLIVAGVSILLPGCLIGLELLAAMCRPAVRHGLHRGIMGLLWICLAFVLCQVALGKIAGLVIVPIAVIAGLVLTWTYVRNRQFRGLVTLCAPGVVLFPAMFLCQALWLKPVLHHREAVSAPTVAISKPTPIVFLIFDALSGLAIRNAQGQVDAERFPAFARLGQRGTWYRNATTVHPRTEEAIPAILTGRYPYRTKRSTVKEHPVNLFTLLLGTEKYRMTVFEPYTNLFPREHDRELAKPPTAIEQATEVMSSMPRIYAHVALPRNLPIEIPSLPHAWFGLSKTGLIPRDKHVGWLRYGWYTHRDDQMNHFLDCLDAPTTQTTCYFQHLTLPHFPWCYLPSGNPYLDDFGLEEGPLGALGELRELWCGDPGAAEQGRLRYLLQVGAVDHHLGAVLDHLEQRGLFDESLIIVMGDHGSSFLPNHSRRGIDSETLADIATIPLFIKYPRQKEGKINDDNVESIDVLPTIADVLGITLPTPVEGRSLLDRNGTPRAKKQIRDDEGRDLDLPADYAVGTQPTPRRWLRLRSGAWPDCEYPLGPHPQLVGKTLKEVNVGEPSPLKLALSRYQTEKQSGPATLAPGLVTGYVKNLPHPTGVYPLAISLNGRICMTCSTLEATDFYGHFTTMIPESTFQPGKNQLELFEIEPNSTGAVLHPCVQLDYESIVKDRSGELHIPQRD